MTVELTLLVLMLTLAFANGANDVSKGIATLAGSGVARMKAAVWWGSIATMLGAVAAAFASQGLVAAFSGKGLLVHPTQDPHFLAAVALGAILWVVFATVTGLPVSTTHALTGALFGAGLMLESAAGLQWGALGQNFTLPLLVSPFLALALMMVVFTALRRALAHCQGYCLCVQTQPSLRLSVEGGAALAAAPAGLTAGSVENCGPAAGVLSRLRAVDGLHWLTAGAASFARGMNDAPKILALGAAVAAAKGCGQTQLYLLVAATMGLGSLLAGLRVTETLALKVTPMTPEEGFSANLVTAALVGFASRLALPVSTTHVSSGAIVGIGLHKGGGSVDWKTVRGMALAWFVTLPAAAAFAALAFNALRAR